MNYEVSTEVVYRAKIPNGIILENVGPDKFKALYKGAIRELRDWYGQQKKFLYGCCRITEGIEVTVQQEGCKYPRWEYIPLRDICKIHIFSIEGVLQIETERCCE